MEFFCPLHIYWQTTSYKKINSFGIEMLFKTETVSVMIVLFCTLISLYIYD